MSIFHKPATGTGFMSIFSFDFSFNNLPTTPIMEKESLENLSLSELCDLLVENTINLLESMEKKADGVTLRDQKKNVELLQEIVRKKRAGQTN